MSESLKERFKQFAIKTAKYILSLDKNAVNNAYVNQLIRSSSSSAANYRAACRAKSTPDFINKLKIVEEELDESIFFLDLLDNFNSKHQDECKFLMNEGNEFLAIIVTSIRTARKNQNNK